MSFTASATCFSPGTLPPGATWRNEAVIDTVVPVGIPVGMYRVFVVVAEGTADEAPVLGLESVEVVP